MRTYGRQWALNPDGTQQAPQPPGFPKWVVVQTDPNGFNDQVYLTTLCQVLLLNLNESPVYSSFGIPAQQTIVSQVQPDFYLSRTQQQFSGFFAALILSKLGSDPPAYRIAITTQQGVKRLMTVPY